ncbi:inactive ubiquitin thioesterase OTULINL-like [Acipenser ruthenus]|uniref:inactive ubiquitin thioesterase OTULINL-like n=1 Tax=Acipenser ruthenus TaxID=7906 RepID=UPI00274176DC|nr:inactive ubiquitin thioesterase OTULINL-like [Acipenser ruthenus]
MAVTKPSITIVVVLEWGDIYGLKDKKAREKACKLLFMDESSEYKMYEAVKFLMLYLAIEMFEGMRHGQDVPNFCAILFSRDTSLDPFSFMLNHLNTIGDSGGLEQIEMFLPGYTLQLQMQTFRLYKYDTEEFEVSFTDVCGRDWHKITLLTEDDRHYNIQCLAKMSNCTSPRHPPVLMGMTWPGVPVGYI